MATLQAYENGLTLGWVGGRKPCDKGSVVYLGPGCCHRERCECTLGSRMLCCAHAAAKRGEVVGWSAGAVRRHTAWLRSVDTTQLDGMGAAVTLTMLDCPPTSDDWARLLKVLKERLRRSGLIRWHWVVEWQRRGVPHLHLAVYAPQNWSAPGWAGSPITDTDSGAAAVGWWVVGQWREVASEYTAGLNAQQVTPITGPVGWLKYLSKHAARGVRHYQRVGKPAGWDRTGRLWGRGGEWPSVEPLRVDLTTGQAWRLRRLVKRYAIAQARVAALGYERSGQAGKADKAWDSVSYLRGMLKSSDQVGACRGMSEWASQEVVMRLAVAAGWNGVLA